MSSRLSIARPSSTNRVLRTLLLIIALFGFAGGIMQAADENVPGLDSISSGEVEQAHAEHAEEGMPLKALTLPGISPTNSMIVTWIVALGIIIFARIATRNIKEVPDGAQN